MFLNDYDARSLFALNTLPVVKPPKVDQSLPPRERSLLRAQPLLPKGNKVIKKSKQSKPLLKVTEVKGPRVYPAPMRDK